MTLKSRRPAMLAADACAAYEQLTEHRPDGISDDVLDRHLTVLAARMNDHHTSNTQLASTMDPPMSAHWFGKQLRVAIDVAGVIREPIGRRTYAELTADVREAHERLIEHRPEGISDNRYQRHLAVLAARIDNPGTSSAQLAAAMDPPVTTVVFEGWLHRAVAVSKQPATSRIQRDRRTLGELADDARKAHAQLTERRPEGIGDDVYQRYLAVLGARRDNPDASSTQLATAMDPSMSKDKFNAIFFRAIRASVRKERLPRPPKPHGIPGPNAARQASDAAAAFAVLRAHRPDRLTDDRYVQLLTVLTVRMHNPTMTYRQLGAQLDPPLTAGGFYGALRRAHDLAGVDHTFTPHARRAAHHQQDAAA